MKAFQPQPFPKPLLPELGTELWNAALSFLLLCLFN